MKRISLTQGKEALVDDCDYGYLMQWKWHFHSASNGKSGYAERTAYKPTKRQVRMHLVVAARKGLRTRKIDHKNQNKLDNQRRNLRKATNSQNQGNVGLRSDNESGYKGVSRNNRDRRWETHFCLRGKNRTLGGWPLTAIGKVKAAYAYDVAALKKFKKHASINHASKLLDASIKRQIERHVIDHLKSYQ